MGCVEQVTPFLNEAVGQNNWNVDVNDQGKVLTVTAAEDLSERVVMKAVVDAGYKAEQLN